MKRSAGRGWRIAGDWESDDCQRREVCRHSRSSAESAGGPPEPQSLTATTPALWQQQQQHHHQQQRTRHLGDGCQNRSTAGQVPLPPSQTLAEQTLAEEILAEKTLAEQSLAEQTVAEQTRAPGGASRSSGHWTVTAHSESPGHSPALPGRHGPPARLTSAAGDCSCPSWTPLLRQVRGKSRSQQWWSCTCAGWCAGCSSGAGGGPPSPLAGSRPDGPGRTVWR